MPLFESNDIINNLYRIESLLGEGGFSKVYKVHDLQTKNIYALKVLKQKAVENAAILQRFLKEAHILKEINHPHIVHIYDIYAGEKLVYIVMEYLEGRNLAEFLKTNNAQKPSWALAFISQLLEATDFLHQKGILHRDLKPSNIMLIEQKNADESAFQSIPLIKIIDFGIAKIMDEKDTRTSDAFLGTPLYMAPERLGRSECSVSSDIYSIGEMLWHILTGQPRCKDMHIETMIAFKNKSPDFHSCAKDFSNDKEEKTNILIAKKWMKIAMHPDPGSRFQACKDALAFIEKPGTRFRMLRKKVISRIAFITGILIVLASIIIIPADYFINRQLYDLKVAKAYVIGQDRKGNKLWEFESTSKINDAKILTNLSSSRKEVVLITTAEYSTDINNENILKKGSQIWLLDLKGKMIWMRQLGGKELIPGSGILYNARFRLAEDLDDDSKKELIFTSTNLQSYPGFLVIFRPDDGSFYGSCWNYGDDFHTINMIKKDTKKYLSLISYNNSLETDTITELEVSKSFRAISPGWSEYHLSYLKNALSFFDKTAQNTRLQAPRTFLHELNPNKNNDEPISTMKTEAGEIIKVRRKDASFYYNWEGYPVNASGTELFLRNKNALSPNDFLWELNPYFTFSEEKNFPKAIQLCQNLISRTPNVPQHNALIYMLLGKAQMNLGDRKGAIENFNKSLTIKPDANGTQIHLAEALILNKQYEEAYKLLTENYSRMKDSNHLIEATKYLMFLDSIKPKKEFQTYSALMKKYKIYEGYLREQYLCYDGNTESTPFLYYYSFELTEKFWRWRIAHEVLLQKKPLRESWKQVPAKYYGDPGLSAIRSLVESRAHPDGLSILEKEAQGNLESYLFLPAAYLLYADQALKQNNKKSAYAYMQKALKSDPIGHLKSMATAQ